MDETKSFFYDFVPISFKVTEEEKKQILNEYPTPVLPQGNENFNITEKEKGEHVSVRLLLNEFSIETTKTDKQFIKARFSNNYGVVNTKIWNNQDAVERFTPLLEQYSVFDVEGRIEDYKGHKSISINKLYPCEEEFNPFTLLSYTKQDIEELTIELFSYLYELNSPFKEVSIAAMQRFWNQFSIRPAAKGFHHNYLGGLLKHTVGLMRFARFILKHEENHFQAVMKLINVVEKAHKADIWKQITSSKINTQQLVWKETTDHLYNMLFGMMEHTDTEPDYDLIMTSILYHDIGKLLEYDHAGKTFEEFKFLYPTANHTNIENRKQTGIIMDELGVMIGHIPYGVLIFTKIVENENIKFSLEDIHHISHCILCHHGLPEWGSCIRNPRTIEGYIVHICDFLDSRYENTEDIK